jgi:hypothetical protein
VVRVLSALTFSMVWRSSRPSTTRASFAQALRRSSKASLPLASAHTSFNARSSWMKPRNRPLSKNSGAVFA